MKIGKAGLLSLLIVVGLYAYKGDPITGRKFIETSYMDSSVKPGDNFFLFVNGSWIKNTDIPPTETRIGSFLDVYNTTKNNIKAILDSVSTIPQPVGSLEKKVGDFYAAGMDTLTIEKLGYAPVKPYLQQIVAVRDLQTLLTFEAQMHKQGFSYIAAFGIGPDDKNSSLNVAGLYQTGLGLPDRDYYFKTDDATKSIQDAYKNYMKTIFMLTGDDLSNR